MKNTNFEYKKTSLNTMHNINTIIQQKNNIPKIRDIVLFPLQYSDKLIRHNPAATSEWDNSLYSYANVESQHVKSNINRARITIYKYNRQKVYINMLKKSFTLWPNKNFKKPSVNFKLNIPSKKVVTTIINPSYNYLGYSNNKINSTNLTSTLKRLKKEKYLPLTLGKKEVRSFGSSAILRSKYPKLYVVIRVAKTVAICIFIAAILALVYYFPPDLSVLSREELEGLIDAVVSLSTTVWFLLDELRSGRLTTYTLQGSPSDIDNITPTSDKKQYILFKDGQGLPNSESANAVSSDSGNSEDENNPEDNNVESEVSDEEKPAPEASAPVTVTPAPSSALDTSPTAVPVREKLDLPAPINARILSEEEQRAIQLRLPAPINGRIFSEEEQRALDEARRPRLPTPLTSKIQRAKIRGEKWLECGDQGYVSGDDNTANAFPNNSAVVPSSTRAGPSTEAAPSSRPAGYGEMSESSEEYNTSDNYSSSEAEDYNSDAEEANTTYNVETDPKPSYEGKGKGREK
jgi:hypothetical protein